MKNYHDIRKNKKALEHGLQRGMGPFRRKTNKARNAKSIELQIKNETAQGAANTPDGRAEQVLQAPNSVLSVPQTDVALQVDEAKAE